MTAALRGLLARPPEPGTNTVLVTQTFNIQSAIGLDVEAVGASPDGAGGYTIVARVLAEHWDQLDAAPAADPLGGPGLLKNGYRTSPSAQALPTSARQDSNAAR